MIKITFNPISLKNSKTFMFVAGCIFNSLILCGDLAHGENIRSGGIEFSSTLLVSDDGPGNVFLFLRNYSAKKITVFTRPTFAGWPMCRYSSRRIPAPAVAVRALPPTTPVPLPAWYGPESNNNKTIYFIYANDCDVYGDNAVWWRESVPELKASNFVMPVGLLCPLDLDPGQATMLASFFIYSSESKEPDYTNLRFLYEVEPAVAAVAGAWSGSVLIKPGVINYISRLPDPQGVSKMSYDIFPFRHRWPFVEFGYKLDENE